MIDSTIGIITDFFNQYPEAKSNVLVETRFGFKEIEEAAITAKKSEVIKIITETGEFLKCSPNHLILSNNSEWINAKNLKVNDFLFTRSGATKISKIKLLKQRNDLYDLQVKDVKEFYANNIVSHNSTILDSVTYALFGRAYRKINKPQLVNSVNQKDCLIECEFEANGHSYLVRRGMKPGIFEVFMDGELLNQESKNRDYQKILEKQILKLNYQSFTQIVILGSAAFQPFMQLSANSRRQVIEDLLDISIFSLMKDELKFKISQSKDKLKLIKQSIKFQEDKIYRQENFISKMNENKNIHKKEIEKENKKFEKEIEDIINKIEKKKTKIETISKSITEKILPANEQIQKLNRLISEKNRKILELNKKKKFYSDNNICPTCDQSLTKDHKHTHLTELDSEIDQNQKSVENCHQHIEKFETEKNKLYSKGFSQEHLDNLNTEIKVLKNRQENLQEQIVLNENKITLLNENKDSSNDLEKELQDLIKEKEEQETKYKKIYTRVVYFNELERILSDTGIKSKIIKNYIPTINSLVNKYLRAMEFQISFHLNENFEETIKSRYRDDFSYYSFSEGEKLRIDLALLFTWREISQMKNSTNTNIIFMDEITDRSFDEEGIKCFLSLLDILTERNISSIVISHNDKLRDKFEVINYVQKDGNFSHMKSY